MPAVCAYPKKLEEPAANCKVVRVPKDWDGQHSSKRKLVRMIPPVPGLYPCFTHANCECNELVSAANRVCGAVPEPDPQAMHDILSAAKVMGLKLGHTPPLTVEEFVEGYEGRKRTRYENAAESLTINPVHKGDSRVSAFVKSEKFDPSAKENPDPRMIQARNARFNTCLGRFLRPMEKRLYGLRSGITGLRYIAKGLNQPERAKLLLRKMEAIPDCAVISIDCSRWDKHIGEGLLRAEHMVYKTMNSDPELAKLLEWQIHNTCWTQHGVFYKTLAKRNSGDMNTACGNCVLMVLCVEYIMKRLGISCWDMLDDGDDCLLIVRKDDLSRIMSALPGEFLRLGHEVKVEDPVSEPEAVLFCQTHLVRTGLGPTMVRDWRKVLSQSVAGTRHWNDPKLFRSMLWAVGKCELALNQGVPILQSFAEALIRNGDGKGPKMFEGEFEVHYKANLAAKRAGIHWTEFQSKEITDEARVSFDAAFGVSSWEQVAIEERLANWTIDSIECEERPSELDHSWQQQTAVGHDPVLVF